MAILDIFYKRRRQPPDVHQHETLPEPLRMQIVYIVDEAFTPMAGAWMSFSAADIRRQVYGDLQYHLAKEYGVARLAAGKGVPDHADSVQRVQDFIFRGEVERVLDLIEVALHLAFEYAAKRREFGLRDPHASIEELNRRFREHGVGYQIVGGKAVKTGSLFTHNEIVKPALAVLHDRRFEGADAEFRRAHEHHRHSRYEEAIADCLKALESTLKMICKHRGWQFKQTDTANRLIEIAFSHDLIPNYLESQFAALRSVMQSGVPTIRNKMSGHGAGESPRRVPEHLSAYALHLTASAMLFLTSAP